MSALVAFEVGEVSLKSPTFEGIMTELLERSQDPVDREVCADALVGNCLWVDQVPEARRAAVLADLWSVLESQLRSGVHDDNLTALYQIHELMAELLRRYRGPLTRQLPELVVSLRWSESTGHLRATVLKLLDESPISREAVLADIRESVAAGEVELAFDTMCGWIYEDQLEIDRDYYVRLLGPAGAMGAFPILGRLLELVRET